jgi:hypothetical protein
VRFDFARWIALELRAQVVNWTLVLLHNKAFERNNQRSCPLLVLRKPPTPTPAREQFASIPAPR